MSKETPTSMQTTGNIESGDATRAQVAMDNLVERFVSEGMSEEDARAAAVDEAVKAEELEKRNGAKITDKKEDVDRQEESEFSVKPASTNANREETTPVTTTNEATSAPMRPRVVEAKGDGNIETRYGTAKVYTVNESAPPDTKRVLVVPGYSETIIHNEALVHALATEGYKVATFSQPRKMDKDSETNPIDRQAEILITMIESLTPDDEKINLAAHSLGSAVTLRAAELNPELFKRVESVTLMQPSGMTEEQGFPEQLQRVGKKVAKNQAGTIKGQDPRKVPEKGYAARIDEEPVYRYFGRTALAQVAGGVALARNPKLGYKEARAAGGYTSLAEDIKKIEDQGVKVNVITSYGDEMYDLTTDWDEVKGDNITHAEGRKVVHPGYSALAQTQARISTIADKDARHDSFWQQPRRTAEIIKQHIDPDPVTRGVREAASESSGRRPQFFDAEVEAPFVNRSGPQQQEQEEEPTPKEAEADSGAETTDTQEVSPTGAPTTKEEATGEAKTSTRARPGRRTGIGVRIRRKSNYPEPSDHRLHGKSDELKSAVELAAERVDRGNMTVAQEQKALDESWIPIDDENESYKLGDFERQTPELPDDYTGRALLEDGSNIKVLGLEGAINGVRYYRTSEGIRTENQLEFPTFKKQAKKTSPSNTEPPKQQKTTAEDAGPKVSAKNEMLGDDYSGPAMIARGEKLVPVNILVLMAVSEDGLRWFKIKNETGDFAMVSEKDLVLAEPVRLRATEARQQQVNRRRENVAKRIGRLVGFYG